MEVKIKNNNGLVDATIEMVDGVMIVSPKVERFAPKNGDVVTVEDGSQLFLIKSVVPNCKNTAFCYLGFDFEDNEIILINQTCLYTRLATVDEKKKLFDKLKEEGYEWKPATKELVKLKWKPKYRETYFAPFFSNVDFLFSTCRHTYTEHFSDELTIKRTRVFKTEEECQEFCNRLNDAINSVKP